MSTHSQIIKVVLLGDSGVGKSSIALRFATNEFKPYSEATIGASFMSKLYTFNDDDDKNNNNNNDSNGTDNSTTVPTTNKRRNRSIDFKIWDTAGQEKYHSLAPMYYRGSRAAILCFDITNPGTFTSLKKWVDELSVNGPRGLVLVVCGNKYDLRDRRKVDQDEARDYAESVGAIYMEASARDDVNVERIFLEIGRRVAPAEELEILKAEGKMESVIDLAAALTAKPKGFVESYC